MTHATLSTQVGRRELLLGLSAAIGLPSAAFARDVIELTWADLRPVGEQPLPPELQGIIQHEMGTLMSQQPEATGFRSEWNGKTVSLSGFVVPLDFDGTAITNFILVPFVGACVHVPPPPANQLVLVTTEEPYVSGGLFEAVNVTGPFGTSGITTELAQIGYAMTAEKVKTLQF